MTQPPLTYRGKPRKNKPGAGRPARLGDAVAVNLWLPIATRADLDNIAKSDGVSRSVCVARIIAEEKNRRWARQ